MDFIVTLKAKGGNVERFLITAPDDAAARERIERDRTVHGAIPYRLLGGGMVHVVWRNLGFPDVTIEPVPCS